MEKLLLGNQPFSYFEYQTEKEFEQVIIKNSNYIFGEKTIYVDIKKRIGDSILTIPDGYLIDFSFPSEPRLYILENELSSHDPYKHIGSQILKFAISYKASGRKIKEFLLQHIYADQVLKERAETALTDAGYRNIDAFLESIIFEKPVAAIVIIDRITEELENVLGQLTIDTDIIEFQTFVNNGSVIHKFSPFNGEIREYTEKQDSHIKAEDLDTIVVAAREEGFEREFIGNNVWFAIRISASMIDKVKYIAAYQIAPVSAITHYAEVSSIEKWNDTNKYLLKFKGPAIQIKPIPLDKDKKGVAPQAPRYTSLEKMLDAKVVSEVFS